MYFASDHPFPYLALAQFFLLALDGSRREAYAAFVVFTWYQDRASARQEMVLEYAILSSQSVCWDAISYRQCIHGIICRMYKVQYIFARLRQFLCWPLLLVKYI
jgi:hypothetical protein